MSDDFAVAIIEIFIKIRNERRGMLDCHAEAKSLSSQYTRLMARSTINTALTSSNLPLLWPLPLPQIDICKTSNKVSFLDQ